MMMGKVGALPRYLLAAISGLIYAMAYPPVDCGPLVFLGLLGFLTALRGASGLIGRMVGLVFGVVAFGVSLSWLWILFEQGAVALWLILAIFTLFFAAMQGVAASRGLVSWKLATFTAINWSACEFFRAEVFPLKFPWMTTGLAIGPNALLPLVGVYGVGFVVVFLVMACLEKSWKPGGVALLLLSGSLIWWKKHPLPDVSVGNAIRVAGIQMEGASVIEYMEETRKLPEGTQYVLWPEYAIPFDVRKSARNWQHLLDLCRERGITLTVGTQARPEADEWRNIALTMDASGYLGEHTKMHPVHFFNDGKAGTEASVVDTEHGLVGTPICFDADYEGVVRKMTAEGAEVIFIPTMDAESWSARQHDQHAELAHMRAAENARWIFACASSGVSQMIDPNGYVHQRLQALEQGAISGVVLRETKLSFYTQWGWLFGWVILGVGVVSWVLVFSLKAKPASPT